MTERDDKINNLIRSAEKFIAAKKFRFASEQIQVARTLDPFNPYLDAIVERIRVLSLHQKSPLEVTVGAQFESGVKEPAPSKDLQAQVRHLTSVAEKFCEKGLFENAFDSLMKAYLLDPSSPYVASCENSVLPAWQQHHTTNATTGDQHLGANKLNTQQGVTMSPVNNFGRIPVDAGRETAEDMKRLEALKLQRELQRKEREQAMWREASGPPKIAENKLLPTQAPGTPSQHSKKPESSLFQKLKLGKFLNP